MVKTAIRKNVTMSKNLSNWLEQRAEELGISQSALIVLAIADYIKQDKAMDMMSNSGSILKQLEELQSNIRK